MKACVKNEYHFVESFDTNLTSSYEADWNYWQIVREFISNALDSVKGDHSGIEINHEGGYVNITDRGNGYPIVYAKRIGATSKRADGTSIGQFGEGTKMALLTCLRKGIRVYISSQDWMIIPRLAPDEEGLEVLLFDIYQGGIPIQGSTVGIEAVPEILEIIHRKNEYFTQFSSEKQLFTCSSGEILPRSENSKLYNKGVFIREVEALFNYNLYISELNRDRDLISEDVLLRNLKTIWESVDVPDLMRTFYETSRSAEEDINQNQFKELSFPIYPDAENMGVWEKTFYQLYGDQAVLHTHELAAKEAVLLGYKPISLEVYGQNLAHYVGVPKDIDVIRKDFEYTWTEELTSREQGRIDFFNKVASTMLGAELPGTIRVFDSNSKSDSVLGCYDPENDAIYLKRELLNDNRLHVALDVFIHELNHRETGADDYSREFADGLTSVLSRLCLRVVETSGIPVTLTVNQKGLKLPESLRFSADDMTGIIITVENELIVEVAGTIFRTRIQNIKLKASSLKRQVLFYQGSFYLKLPAWLREILAGEISFNMLINTREL